MKRRVVLFWAICGFAFWAWQDDSSAATYYNYKMYPGNGVDGPIGIGTLAMSNNTYTVYAHLVKGMGTFSDNLVIFIDCAPGGYTSTSPFSDKDTALQTAISGLGLSRSTATFAPGFAADYAIALNINHGSEIYKLVTDATGTHLQFVRSGLNFVYTDNGNHSDYSFQFDWADLGLPNRLTNFFKFESTYISDNGYRSLQSYEGLTGKEGYDFITFTNYDTYGVQPVPENTTVALAVFGGLALSVVLGKRIVGRQGVR